MPGKGPPKTPTAILKLRGSKLANARADEIEPEDCDADYIPEELSGKALIEWQDKYPRLTRLGITSELDMIVLELYCSLLVRLREAIREYANPDPDTDPRHGIKLTDLDRMESQMLRYLSHLGMTPSSRASIKPSTPKAKGNVKKKYHLRESTG